MTYQLFVCAVFSLSIACQSHLSPINTAELPTTTPEPTSETTTRDYVDIKPCPASELARRPKADGKKAIEGGVLNQWVSCGYVPEIDVHNVPSGRILVDVTFDGAGIPIKVESDNSDRAVAGALVNAAKATRFRPVLLGGDPMIVKGVLLYTADSVDGVHIPLMKP